jgi:hypothetical protein
VALLIAEVRAWIIGNWLQAEVQFLFQQMIGLRI